MHIDRPWLTVFLAAAATLAIGFSRTPLWDEDEARFAAIARTMVETGDWVVPIYNDTLAVDKPVLMHWCMAAAMTVFGTNEFAARLPSVLAALATALALFRAGRRWCDDATGVIAALAYVGCLLVAIEAHAATPDAILVALTAWATLLLAEPVIAGLRSGATALPRIDLGRAVAAGGLLGLAVVCKGPIGFVGPVAVIGPWCWLLACDRRWSDAADHAPRLRRLAGAAAGATLDAMLCLRPILVTLAAIATAAPWYVAVSLQTGGAWTEGFFFVHNVGRFMAPMEKHGGGILFHPLTMLVGFYPWSCFLPLAIVIAIWKVWTRGQSAAVRAVAVLMLLWFAVWVGGFSAAATKLPNYVLPAYPAAAFLVAMVGVEAARRAATSPTGPTWSHPLWMASGLGWLAFGGVATAATVLVATRYGLTGVEPAALVGVVPILGAIVCWRLASRRPEAAVIAFALTGLVYTALAVGPAGSRIAEANALPALVRSMQARDGGTARLGTYQLANPNVVFYSNGHVSQFTGGEAPGRIAEFLRSGTDAVLLLSEDRLAAIRPALPAGIGIIARARPAFRQHDVVAIGTTTSTPDATEPPPGRTASAAGTAR